MPVGLQVFKNQRANYHVTLFHTSKIHDPRPDATVRSGGVQAGAKPSERPSPTQVRTSSSDPLALVRCGSGESCGSCQGRSRQVAMSRSKTCTSQPLPFLQTEGVHAVQANSLSAVLVSLTVHVSTGIMSYICYRLSHQRQDAGVLGERVAALHRHCGAHAGRQASLRSGGAFGLGDTATLVAESRWPCLAAARPLRKSFSRCAYQLPGARKCRSTGW